MIARACLSVLFGLGLLLSQSLSIADVSDLSVTDRQLVSKKRASRSGIDYTYTITVDNAGSPLTGVVATVSSLSRNTVIQEAEIVFGSLSSSITQSTDTFTLRQNRRVPFDPADLVYTFSADEPTSNTAPLADAGNNVTIALGSSVMLDGSGSTDADGDRLTYLWSFVSKPAGSAATLSDPTAVMPTFPVDVPGTYILQLVVNDGAGDSSPDTVEIDTLNSAPVADAGPDQTVPVGGLVQLDGSASTDVDGDPLSYTWKLNNLPSSSTAVLSNTFVVDPSFVVDVPGTYTISLLVNDGSLDSETDIVLVVTENSAPVADAGIDQTVTAGSTVQLVGSGSNDADNDPLNFLWSFTNTPIGSNAVISDPMISGPDFVVDLEGLYIVQLIVNDGQVDSDPDTVIITTNLPDNQQPTAVASASATAVSVGTTVSLDGSASSDPEDDPLMFLWILSKPAGSTAVLSSTTSAMPNFTVDVEGAYTATLVVNDGDLNSDPASVMITAAKKNNPPNLIAVGNRSIPVGQSFITRLFAIDPDPGDSLTFSLVLSPVGMSIDAVTGDLRWTPTTAQLGSSNSITALVTDAGGLFDTENFTVEVTQSLVVPPVNTPPQLAPIDDQTLTVENALILAATASDADVGDTLTFSFPLAPSGMVIDSATGEINWTPTANQAGQHDITVQVSDAAGAIAVQSAIVTVKAIDRPPVANDDVYTARIGKTLNVAAPGILQNDSDPDGGALTAQLVSDSTTGTLTLNNDGSFDYLVNTPLATTEAVPVAGDLVQLVSPVRIEVSSSRADRLRSRAIDGDLSTSWFTEDGDAANLGAIPTFELNFPQDVSVTELQMFGNRESPDGFDILKGVFQLFDRAGVELFNSGVVLLPAPDRDITVPVPSVDGVRRVRFTVTSDESLSAGFSELKVIGSAVTRSMKRRSDVELTRFGSVEVEASSADTVKLVASFGVDQSDFSHWRSSVDDSAPQYDITFPGQGVTVKELRLSGPRNQYGITKIGWSYATCRFLLLDSSGVQLWDSGVVTCFSDAARNLVLPVPAIENVQTVRFLGLTREDDRFGAGFAEIKVIGDGAIWPIYPTVEWSWTEAASGSLSSNALFGNVSNTPISIDLDGDGFMEIVFAASTSTDFFNKAVGNIVVLDGRTGAEKQILDDVTLRVNASTSMAAGDIDGDGRPEIIAVAEVVANVWQLICFEDDLTVKWRSDVIEPLNWGGITIANIDTEGLPEILVGRQALDANGKLLWTGSQQASAAIPIAADIDLDGLPEVIAGSIVYRGDGTLLWSVLGSRSTAIGNFDDDPFAEVVVSSLGRVRVYEHDGTLKWDTPVSDQGGGSPTVADFDGDGKPEVGVLFARNYVVLDTDGSILWKMPGFDGSGRTGASVADLDGDGSAEVIQRDESFLRIFRGADGALLFQTPISSSTADEGPVIADIDSDGQAEIIITSTAFSRGNVARTKGIVVIGGFDGDWVRTRKIWNQHAYHVTNVNEDGTIPVVERNNWLTPGLNNYRQNAYSPDDKDRLESFTYKAVAGGKESNVATVSLDALAPNAAPEITSVAITSATVGFEYLYAVSALDPDLDPLLFSLVEGPVGMAIDPPTGLLRWSPANADIGDVFVTVRVSDSAGLNVTQRYKLTASGSVLVPDVTGQTRPQAGVTLGGVNLNEGVVRFSDDPSVAIGLVISQSPPAGSVAEFEGGVDLFISIGPGPADIDNDGDGFTENLGDCNETDNSIFPGATDIPGDGIDQDCDGSDAAVPPASILVLPANMTLLTGEVVNLTATGINNDGTSRNLTGLASWSASPNFSSATAGTFTVSASLGGVSGSASVDVVSRVSGDVVPPVAEIISPAGNTKVNEPIEVVGTASDNNFLKYTLEIAPVGELTFSEIGGGTSPVNGDVLGTLDPTVLVNGIYVLRLLVIDAAGNMTAAETDISVEGGAKPGLFSLTFTDLSIPLGGLPIEISRTYDSRDKSLGDFGIGWRLAIRSFSVSCNPLGDNWFASKFSFSFALLPVQSHSCSVRLPNGRIERFEFQPSPAASVIIPLSFLTGKLVPLPGSLGNLKILDNNNLLIVEPQPGPVRLLDDSTLNTFSPERFEYAAENGFVFVIGPDGLESFTDNNGNQIIFTEDKISHSSGVALQLSRDSLGRLTSIVDPIGNAQFYNYSAAGDLIEHIDASGAVTRMFYDYRHLLIRMDDPLGHAMVRNEYDLDGRRTATVDAEGNRTTFDYDLLAGTVTTTNPYGTQMVIKYNPGGNVGKNSTTVVIDGVNTVVENFFEYDAEGNETAMVNADGLRIERTFDGPRVTQTIIDPAGLRLIENIQYDASGDLLQTTDAFGYTRKFNNDSRGNPLFVDGPGDVDQGYQYDDSGRINVMVDPLNNRTVLSYNPAGLVTSRERFNAAGDRLGRTELIYDLNGNLIENRLIDVVGGGAPRVSRFTYNASNRLLSRTDPEGNVETWEYDAAGNLTVTIDAIGRRISYEYNLNGFVQKKTLADGGVVTFEYDALGNVIKTTDPEGRVRELIYDELGRRVGQSLDGTAQERRVFSAAGRLLAVVAVDGKRTDYQRDTAGRITQIQLPGVTDGRTGVLVRPTVKKELDALGRSLAIIDSNGGRTEFQYDANGRLSKRVAQDGTSVSQVVDAAGNLVSVTNELGATIDYDYDAMGRLVRVLQPPPESGAPRPSTLYNYGSLGNLVNQIDALGRKSQYEYDNAGRVTRKLLPDGSSQVMEYNPAGQIIRLTESDGVTTSFSYDLAGRLSQRSSSTGLVETITYNLSGDRLSTNDARGASQYSYFGNGLLKSITEPDGSQIAYIYDSNQRVSQTSAAGDIVNYTYDSNGRLASVNSQLGLTTYSYDPMGNPVKVGLPNGIQIDSSYNSRGRIVSLKHTDISGVVLEEFLATYKADGRRESISEIDGSAETYQYDNLGRLVSAQRLGSQPFSHEYEYDIVGNRVREVINGVQILSGFDANDQLSFRGTDIYTYDARGNRVASTVDGETLGYQWDAYNRLAGVTYAGGTVSYQYDIDGQRVSENINGTETRFMFDQRNPSGLSQVVKERDASGRGLVSYTYGLQIVGQSRSTVDSFYALDPHGSVRMLTDSTSAISDRYSYQPYGKTNFRSGTTVSPYAFSGERLDEISGHYNLRARQYDPGSGRFISRDLFSGDRSSPSSLHPYLYAGADPINFADPLGLFSLTENIVVQTISSGLSKAKNALNAIRGYCKAKGVSKVVNTISAVSQVAVAGFGLLAKINRSDVLGGTLLDKITVEFPLGDGNRMGLEIDPDLPKKQLTIKLEIDDEGKKSFISIEASPSGLKGSGGVGKDVDLVEFQACGITFAKLSAGVELSVESGVGSWELIGGGSVSTTLKFGFGIESDVVEANAFNVGELSYKAIELKTNNKEGISGYAFGFTIPIK